MTRAELKQRAKDQLGNSIFGSNYMSAVLVILVEGLITGALSIIPGIGSLASLLMTGPITFGVAYLFLKQAHDGQPMQVGGLFNGFQSDFGGLFLLHLMSSIFIFLWTLLLIVPGIIKSISYSMAYFVKVDHPDYTWKQCLDESSRLMNGHKMDYFVLQLSFIGWLIVGALCFGIGTLWVSAYMNATDAQFYESIKSEPILVN